MTWSFNTSQKPKIHSRKQTGYSSSNPQLHEPKRNIFISFANICREKSQHHLHSSNSNVKLFYLEQRKTTNRKIFLNIPKIKTKVFLTRRKLSLSTPNSIFVSTKKESVALHRKLRFHFKQLLAYLYSFRWLGCSTPHIPVCFCFCFFSPPPYIKYFCFGSVEMQIKEITIASESDAWVLDPNWR